MKLTYEQQTILKSTGNLRINAVAGSGKTTTIIEYAKTRPEGSKILYLAFNKSVKLEAIKKFREKGLPNVKIETAHSLAYKHIVGKHGYTVRAEGYKSHELVDLLRLRVPGDKHAADIVASHINRFTSYYCNSTVRELENLNYLDVVTEPKARTFVRNHYSHILKNTKLLLERMATCEMEITHDFYLKQFQLNAPQLGFDYILFDEGQDASSAMLDVFLKQHATKVIVGDTHQQIYGWRFAVNSLEKTNFSTHFLSTSFRFKQDIGDLAMQTLQLKNHLAKYQPISITGKGSNDLEQSRAVIGRTNLGLLLAAIYHVIETKSVSKIYFEGNINSYTYADDGASLYDVLHLYNGARFRIRDKLIRSMNDMRELEEYIDKTEDMQLNMMVEIIKKYRNEIPTIIKTLKEKHVPNEAKHEAEMIFSTVHRCKGMEYDIVELVNDFITEEKLMKLKRDIPKEKLQLAQLLEEINLLYVAITRTRTKLTIPSTLVPKGFKGSESIVVINLEDEEVATEAEAITIIESEDATTQKAYSVEKIRKEHAKAYLPWSDEMDTQLSQFYRDQKSVTELSKHFGRTRGAIYSRLKRLELTTMK